MELLPSTLWAAPTSSKHSRHLTAANSGCGLTKTIPSLGVLLQGLRSLKSSPLTRAGPVQSAKLYIASPPEMPGGVCGVGLHLKPLHVATLVRKPGSQLNLRPVLGGASRALCHAPAEGPPLTCRPSLPPPRPHCRVEFKKQTSNTDREHCR